MSAFNVEDYQTLKPPPTPAKKPEPASDPQLHIATNPLRPESVELHDVSHYRVTRLIGQGGMGRVYQAEDRRLLRVVALKVMLADTLADTESRDRFLREARSLAAVHNDHVVTIYDADLDNEQPFLAMEYLEGQSLEKWLKTGETPRIGDILRIGREIASGLAAAHALDLIHRDIKPANIWLQAPSARVKILDFGLARSVQLDAGLTRVGEVMGTPYYMSPEQCRGENLDARSDVFSLGVVLYQLCTGRLPFQGPSVAAVLTSVATHDPPPPSSIHTHLPEGLSQLVMRMLEKAPERRPPSAMAVHDALVAIEDQLPAEAGRILLRGKARDTAETPTLGPGAFHKTLPENHSSSAKPSRRSAAAWKLTATWMLIAAGIAGAWRFRPHSDAQIRATPNPETAFTSKAPIRLGLLYSRTGMLAGTEHPIYDGVMLAVSEINDAGGLLGRKIEVFVEDYRSDDSSIARKVEKLIDQDKVCAVIGCSTSSSRKEVKPVVEKHNHLLLFPRSYEGMENSNNIVYGGQVPNQQILPALRWTFGFLSKKRWYLLGSDSFYGRANSEIIRDEAKALGVEIVGEKFCTCGDTDMTGIARSILQAKPDLVINSLVGDSNVAFFRSLHREGNRADRIAVLSFVISEQEMTGLTPAELEGHYCSGHYFHSIDTPRNREFLRLVAAKFDDQLIVSSSMQTSYMLVHLWANAVRAAETCEVNAVRAQLPGQSYEAPQGRVTIDSANLHVEQRSRVGQCNANGQFEEVFISPRPVPPQPYLTTRTRSAWEQFTRELHERWGGQWHK